MPLRLFPIGVQMPGKVRVVSTTSKIMNSQGKL